MHCTKCDYPNDPNSQYCGNCGSKLAMACPSCSSENPSSHKFCANCGTDLRAANDAPPVQPAKKETKPTNDTAGTDSELRHLTLMFCDLADSTALSSSLGAEDFRLLIRDYQSTCEKVITRYGGYIAQYLGDGLLVYFGYPIAHEDDAMRALHSGLGILKEIKSLNVQLQAERNIQLKVRIGVHSGMVVVGDVGAGGRSERLALGDTTNIAARIEGKAKNGTMVVSRSTLQLVHGFFDTVDLGTHALKGIEEPLHLYQITGVSSAKTRLDVEEIKGLTPIVGRQQEMNLLLTRWREVKSAQSRVVLLNGGAGVGKSRIIRELIAKVSVEEESRILHCYCSPYHKNSAFYPLIELLDKEIFAVGGSGMKTRELADVEKFCTENDLPLEQTVPLFADLFSLPFDNRYEPLPNTAERRKQKTEEALLSTFLNIARKKSLLLFFEDLHWMDASTLELVNLILKQSPTHRILTVLTFRPEFVPPWGIQPHITLLSLSHLPPSESRVVIRQIAKNKPLPEEIVALIIAKTDGIPLFVEELTKSVLESDQLNELEYAYELSIPVSDLAIPGTLHDALVARLDRLGDDKEIAQLGSAIGREFSYELYDALTRRSKHNLDNGLAKLVSSGLLEQRGVPPTSTYQFRHALVQDAAYQSLLKTKRSVFHELIGNVLVNQFVDRLETRPEVIAYHYTQAGLKKDAIKYWYKAGLRSSRRFENLETIAHLYAGLELISSFPESLERDQEEMAFVVAAGPSLIIMRGYGSTEVRDNFSRALALCQKLGRKNEMGQILWGLCVNLLVHGEYERAWETANENLKIGIEEKNNNYIAGSHFHLGGTSFGLANFDSAKSHFDQGLAVYSSQQHEEQFDLFGVNLGMFTALWETHTLWHLGLHHLTNERIEWAYGIVSKLEHPFSWAITYDYTAMVHQFRREPQLVKENALSAIAICRENKYDYYLGWAMIMNGWSTAVLGNCDEGISEIHQGLELLQSTGGKRSLPYYHALLAEAYWMNGQNEVALQTLKKALEFAKLITEPWWNSEIHRLKGVILLSISSDNTDLAEQLFIKALEISRKQKSISLELRIATNLSKIWHDQGKRDKARALISESMAKHHEGLDSRDYQEALAVSKRIT